MSVDRLAAIESNDVHALPVPYLRGFVAAYAAEVGLDRHELPERYLAQFGNELSEFESELPAPPVTSVSPVQSPAPTQPVVWMTAEPPASVVGFRREDPPRAALEKLDDTPMASTSQPLTTSRSRLFLSRRRRWTRRVTPPARLWLYSSFLLLPLLSAIVGFLFVQNRYRLSSSNALVRAVEQQQDAAPSGADDGPAAAGKEVDEPARAAQSDRLNPPSAEPRPRADASRSAADRPETDTSSEPDHAHAASPVHETRGDVSGSWRFTNRVQSASYRAFNGLTLDYHLQLEQTGHRVAGIGEKRSENGRDIAGAARTPITVEGTLEGRRLALRFTEKGTRRASVGMFVMELEGDGSLRGSFSSDAAMSRGTSRATRIDSARE